MNKPPNPERRSPKSHRAILDAALDLCTELEYSQVTMEGIAARAEVSKKTIYRWWPSKAAVVLEAIDDAAMQATALPDTGDLAIDLSTQMSGVTDLLTAPRTRSALLGVITEGINNAEFGEQVRDKLFVPRNNEFKIRLREARENGELAADADVDLVLDLLAGPIWYRLAARLPLPDSAQLAAGTAAVLRGMAPK